MKTLILGILLGLGLVVISTILSGLIVGWLWNELMPLFGLPTLTVWQAIGLCFLTRALFPTFVAEVKP